MKRTLLEVYKLETNYYRDNEVLYVLYDISFKLYKDEIVVLVSEQNIFRQGLIYSLTRTIDKPLGRIIKGEISFEGKNILKLSEKEMRSLRGNKISSIHDTNVSGLNPRLKIGYQVKEPLIIHNKAKEEEGDKKAKEVLEKVGIEEVNRVYESYPHELDDLSIYKVHLAMAIICEPEVLIINNVTEGLGNKDRMEIYQLLQEIKEEIGLSILFMTNELSAAKEIANRVMIADKGILLEDSPIEKFCERPLHPYSKALIKGDIGESSQWKLNGKAHSCIYYDNCVERRELCLKYLPDYITLKEGEKVRCVLYR